MSQQSIATIVLAAGQGKRFGGDKLLALLPNGQTVISQTLLTLLSVLERVVCVVREDDLRLRTLINQLSHTHSNLECLPIVNAGQGMSASLRAGIGWCAAAEAWLVALGDMPYLSPETLQTMCNAYRRERSLGNTTCIVRPRHTLRQQWGHPVLFSQSFYPELQGVSGDRGAREVLAEFSHEIIAVEVSDDGILQDIDRPADLK